VNHVLELWRRLDERFQRIETRPWGAVVTDPRFPLIWDVNYARVETDDARLGLEEIRASLDPALERAGAVHRHIVVFHPETLTGLIAGASAGGARLTWDLVMTLDDEPPEAARAGIDVEEVTDVDEAFLRTVRRSLTEFDVTDPAAADQLMRIEREVMLPAGKRWFRVGEPGGEAALGSLLQIDDVGLVDHIVTMPFARGRGYAEAVTRRIAHEAFALGTRTLVLLTEPNGNARRIYERIGFEPVTTIASTVERR
jgi:ribosomal protein S18 acetylase RimI-like enzyme